MGNQICGQAPSETWTLLSDQFNNRSKTTYDRATMSNISALELDYFNALCDMIRCRKQNPQMLPKDLVKQFCLEDKVNKLLAVMYEYTNEEKYKISTEDINEANVIDKSQDPDEMVQLSCDILLLDYVYGLKQCEYAVSLMDRADAVLKENPEADVMALILEIYRGESSGLVNRLREETVQEVNPCQGAFEMWYSWSVV